MTDELTFSAPTGNPGAPTDTATAPTDTSGAPTDTAAAPSERLNLSGLFPVPTSQLALIVVDVQNDFADPAGSLFVSGAPEILPQVNLLVDAARLDNMLVVYTQDWHPAHTPHFAPDGGIWPVHCVAYTAGAALHPDLRPGPDILIRKGSRGEDGYSAFSLRDPVSGVTSSTPLDQILRDRGVAGLIVCGLATDYCVRATAIDAAARGYLTVLDLMAVAAVNLQPGDGDRAIAEMAAAGVRMADQHKLQPVSAERPS